MQNVQSNSVMDTNQGEGNERPGCKGSKSFTGSERFVVASRVLVAAR